MQTLIPRLLFLVAAPSIAWSLTYRSPKFVLDVVLLLALEPFLPRGLTIPVRLVWVLICGVMLLLEWNILPESYGFYLGMLSPVSGSQQGIATVAALTLLALFVAVPAQVRAFLQPRRTLAACLLIYVIAITAKVSPWGEVNLVDLRLPILRAAQVAATDGRRLFTDSVLGKDPPTDVVGGILHSMVLQHPDTVPEKLLVVVIESWGETPESLQKLLLTLTSQRMSILASGYTAYKGSTLPGEVRELCGHSLNFSRVNHLGAGCLPRILMQQGFHTTALHGYNGFFYYRNLVYPNLGFEDVFFKPELATLADCGGAFSGACDDAVVDTAVRLLLRPGKQFVYMMSLSGHEPVADETLGRAYVRLAEVPLGGSPSQTVNRALVARALHQVFEGLLKNERAWVYVVGDHNPPTLMSAEQTLPVGRVPYVLFNLGPQN